MKKFTKTFKFSLIFFIILFIILPVKQSEAISLPNLGDIWGKIKGALSALGGILGDFIRKIGEIFGNLQNCFLSNPLNSPKCFAELIIKALTLLIEIIAKGFHFFFRLLHYILAFVVDFVSSLNPFEGTGGQQSPAEAFFNVLTTFGYILLIFLALLAAFEVLFEENASAVRIIFAIFIAAFLIVFAFTFVKEAFFVAKKIENGIAGSGLKSLGSFIVVTMWPSDPFELIDKITENIDDEFLKSLIRVGGYIFVLIIDMITIILLFVTIFLFIYRYIIITFLAATSSIAIATLAIPEGKGRFSQFLSGFRYFESWFNSVVRWLLVIPVFVILIIAGNIVRENVFAQLANISSPTAGDLSANEGINLFVQFILIYFLLTIWYIFSLNVANNLSRGAAKMAAGIAVTGLSLIGGLAATGLMAASGATVGKVLTKTGGALEQKVGAGGTLGWRSWVGQKIGKPTREMGEKMLEKRYTLDAAAARSRIKNIDREIAKTTDPTKEKLLLNQFGNLIKQFQNNPYVLKNIQEELKTTSTYLGGKILSEPTILMTLGGPQSPIEARGTVIDLINKTKDSDLKKIINDISWLNIFPLLSNDVQNAILEKMQKEFNETDAIQFVSDTKKLNLLRDPRFQNLRQRLNMISKGFVDGLITGTVDNISDALSQFSENFWEYPKISKNIYDIFKTQGFSSDNIQKIFLETIEKSPPNRQTTIIRSIRKAEDQPEGELRTLMRNAFNTPRGQNLKRSLTITARNSTNFI
jgi:hypothetical protein